LFLSTLPEECEGYEEKRARVLKEKSKSKDPQSLFPIKI
jgi:hypothetical protein